MDGIWLRISGFGLVAALAAPVLAATTWDEGEVVSEATGGQMKAAKGKYREPACNNEPQDYEATVVDLNGDGQPEVFTQVQGTCMGGMTGVFLNLYIRDRGGRWRPQFGFPGVYEVLKTGNKGYPDIQIGGPGFCFPVWRWNGSQYAFYKNVPQEKGGCSRR